MNVSDLKAEAMQKQMMKIELKKISFNEALSEETNAFHAEIFVNGINVGYAKNSGQGGSTDCRPHYDKPENKKLFQQAEEFCLALPPVKYPAAHGGKAFEWKMDLETFVDQLFEDYLKEKENKKLLKKMEKGILISNADKFGNMATISWVGAKTLADVPLEKLQAVYDKYKAQLKPGQEILNKNLAQYGVKL